MDYPPAAAAALQTLIQGTLDLLILKTISAGRSTVGLLRRRAARLDIGQVAQWERLSNAIGLVIRLA